MGVLSNPTKTGRIQALLALGSLPLKDSSRLPSNIASADGCGQKARMWAAGCGPKRRSLPTSTSSNFQCILLRTPTFNQLISIIVNQVTFTKSTCDGHKISFSAKLGPPEVCSASHTAPKLPMPSGFFTRICPPLPIESTAPSDSSALGSKGAPLLDQIDSGASVARGELGSAWREGEPKEANNFYNTLQLCAAMCREMA